MCEFVHCARQPQHIRYLLRLSAKVLLGAGGLENPVVHAKSMECRWLLLFARFALQAHRAKLRPNPAPLVACVDALYAWYSIVLNAGPVLGAPECARMLHLSKNCAVFSCQRTSLAAKIPLHGRDVALGTMDRQPAVSQHLPG